MNRAVTVPLLLAILIMGCQARSVLRFNLRDPLYPERPAQTNVIKVTLDEQGYPSLYSLHLVAATCFDGKCKPLEVTLRWDALGRYAGLHTPPDRPLTRKEHEPFTKENYRRLDGILSNPHSILGKHPLTHFVPVKTPSLHGHDVDGVTGATQVALSETVVPGAAYSSWVLWHWVHGDIVEQLRARTRASCDDTLLLRYLKSTDSGFVAFALDELVTRERLTPAFEKACYRVLEDGGRENSKRALRALANAASDHAEVQEQIIARFGMNGGSSSLILSYLETLPDASPALWEQLADQLTTVSDYRDLEAALKTLKRQASASPVVRQTIEKLARHADSHVAMRAREFLQQDRKEQP